VPSSAAFAKANTSASDRLVNSAILTLSYTFR